MSLLRRLRLRRLGREYGAAWDEWFENDHEVWDSTAADGLDDEA